MSESPKHPIWYEPHPVTAERKAAIRAAGFVILAEEFKPTGHENPDVPALAPSAGQADSATTGATTELTAAQIKEQLTAKGVAFKGNASKGDLLALLNAPAGEAPTNTEAAGQADSATTA